MYTCRGLDFSFPCCCSYKWDIVLLHCTPVFFFFLVTERVRKCSVRNVYSSGLGSEYLLLFLFMDLSQRLLNLKMLLFGITAHSSLVIFLKARKTSVIGCLIIHVWIMIARGIKYTG